MASLKEENKKQKSFLLIYPIVVFIIVWNPLFAKIMKMIIGADVYWRMYWLFPIGITIAYIFTEFAFMNSKTSKKIVINLVGAIIVIMLSGKLVYTSDFFKEVNNPYKIPDEVFEIIDMVSKDNENYKKIIRSTRIYNIYKTI